MNDSEKKWLYVEFDNGDQQYIRVPGGARTLQLGDDESTLDHVEVDARIRLLQVMSPQGPGEMVVPEQWPKRGIEGITVDLSKARAWAQVDKSDTEFMALLSQTGFSKIAMPGANGGANAGAGNGERPPVQVPGA
jgi:hypothetical protein